MNEFVLASIASNKVPLAPPSVPIDITSLPPVSELQFTLNDPIKSLIRASEERFDDLVSAHDLHVLHYEGFGKNLLKKHKFSPDAGAQLIKQLAFHKMFGRPGVTYESAQTRKFKLGRTEVIRSASKESKAWAEAMLSPSPSSPRELKALFGKAAARHVQYSAWAADGQGVDRHLFGLKRLVRADEELPGIYKDPAYGRSSHWELSTSQLSSRYFDGWGYGEGEFSFFLSSFYFRALCLLLSSHFPLFTLHFPLPPCFFSFLFFLPSGVECQADKMISNPVVPDGYGLSYSIGDDYIRWTITSLKRDTKVLKHYLAEAASEVKAMLEAAEKDREAKL
jgi:hypothetical protein